MSIDLHDFSKEIRIILKKHFEDIANHIFNTSDLIKYINIKARSATKGSKARSSFANHYALYVLIEDYIKGEFYKNDSYKFYQGAKFSDLLNRQRELPFGLKLQNHALNHRLNEEFKKYFPTCEFQPIIRDIQNNRYWINENLLHIDAIKKKVNIASAIIEIIDKYIFYKQKFFNDFIEYCKSLNKLTNTDITQKVDFIKSLLKPNVDARIFEIVSFAILKAYYSEKCVFIGFTRDDLYKHNLVLYKTGRVNANDGGIDFVMKPLGRFFQVTETIDVNKYFLDIDKIQRYPVTFVIKTYDSCESIIEQVRIQAEKKYIVLKVVNTFIESIEETINIPILLERLNTVIINLHFSSVIQDIITYSKAEFNIQEDIEIDEIKYD